MRHSSEQYNYRNIIQREQNITSFKIKEEKLLKTEHVFPQTSGDKVCLKK